MTIEKHVEIPLDTGVNSAYKRLLRNSDRFLVLYGGAGSGKSHFIVQKHLARILYDLSKDAKHTQVSLRKVGRTARHSIFKLYRHYISAWGLRSICKINRSEMLIEFASGIQNGRAVFDGGSQIICGGLDDPEKIKSLEGATGIWMEEATEFTYEDFKQLNLRLRGKTNVYKQVYISFNPVARTSWLFEHFFTEPRPNTTILKTTWRDNRFLDAEYIRELENLQSIDPYFHQVYALGEWGVPRDMVFNNWIVKDIPREPTQYPICTSGLDFGYNHPSALVRVGIKDEDVYIYQEIYERQLTNTDLIRKIQSECSMGASEIIIADSAEPARIEEIARHKILISGAIKGKDSISKGLDWLRRRKIYVHPSCVGTIAELQAYKYKKLPDDTVTDVPVDYMNHAMDALRYAVEPYFVPPGIDDFLTGGHTRFGTSKGF